MLLQVLIDVIVQRLGDATAAGMYKLLFSMLHKRASTISLYALPVRSHRLHFDLYQVIDICYRYC